MGKSNSEERERRVFVWIFDWAVRIVVAMVVAEILRTLYGVYLLGYYGDNSINYAIEHGGMSGFVTAHLWVMGWIVVIGVLGVLIGRPLGKLIARGRERIFQLIQRNVTARVIYYCLLALIVAAFIYWAVRVFSVKLV